MKGVLSPLVAVGALLMFLGSTATSVAQSDPGGEFLKEEQRKRQLEQLERSVPGRSIKIREPEAVEKDKVCFQVETIRLQGVTAISPKKLEGVISDYTKTCMGQKAIEALIGKINSAYIERGFITTRAYVPAQDITSGTLLISVVEGRIDSFVYRVVNEKGEARAGRPRKLYSAFPTVPGDILQLRKIEQGLDQINRLTSSSATVDLVPGGKPGTTTIVITEKSVDRYRSTVAYDNNGSEETGRDRVKLTLEIDDLFWLNDTYSLSYVGTENTNVLAYYYSVPYRNWTFSSYGSYSESLSGLTPASDLFSQTASATARINRLLYRDAKNKLNLYGAAGYYWNSRYVNISQLEPQNRTALRAGLKHEYFFDGGVLSVDVGAAFGVPLLGADEDIADAASDTPVAEFKKYDIAASLVYRWKNGMQFISSTAGQYSNQPLFSNEQLTIGGWDSVRGYHGSEVAGDSGVFMRNDLYLPGLKLDGWPKGQEGDPVLEIFRGFYQSLQPFVFVDAGYVYNLALSEEYGIVGTGAGIRGRAGRANFSASVAFPLLEQGLTEVGDIQGLINVSFKIF